MPCALVRVTYRDTYLYLIPMRETSGLSAVWLAYALKCAAGHKSCYIHLRTWVSVVWVTYALCSGGGHMP